LAVVAEVDLDDEQAEAVALLALVAGQDVEAGERPGSWGSPAWSPATGSSPRSTAGAPCPQDQRAAARGL
jgi:hypothetical protein